MVEGPIDGQSLRDHKIEELERKVEELEKKVAAALRPHVHWVNIYQPRPHSTFTNKNERANY